MGREDRKMLENEEIRETKGLERGKKLNDGKERRYS